MAKQTDFRGKQVYECDECGFKYADLETAEQCEKFCRTHNSCSMEITRKALR